MIRNISNKLAYCTSKYNHKFEPEVVAYGLEILFSTALNVVLLIGIAFFFGYGAEMIVFLICFGVLRTSAGGYHAKSHFNCFLGYLFASTAGIWLSQFIPQHWQLAAVILFLLASMIFIYSFAPVQTPNRLIYPKERLKFRRRSIRVGFILLAIVFLLEITGFWHMALVAATAVFVESLTLLPIKQKSKEESE